MRTIPRALTLLVATALTSATATIAPPSFAANPTTPECLDASERAVSLKSTHKLRDARAQFLVCAAATCPSDVRAECQRRVGEMSAAIPTLVFEAKDADGSDLTAVTVSMDGQRLADKLEGIALALDPGAHEFLFEVAGRDPVRKTLVLNEGEKDRREPIVFTKSAEPAPPVPAAAPLPPPEPPPAAAVAPEPAPPPAATFTASSPSPPSYWTTTRTFGAVTTAAGVLGLGIGGLVGLAAKGQFTTAEGETGSARVNDSSSALGTGNAATAIVVVGGVLAAAGIVVWIVAPSPRVGVGVATNGNELVVRARF
ncbi:MAG: hypothetical protein ACLQBL_25750 [Polyangiaceae bacterium]